VIELIALHADSKRRPSSFRDRLELETLFIGERQVHLWLIDTSAYPWEVPRVGLSQHEQQRAERLVFEEDRKRFLAAHCALREMLALRLDCRPSSLEYRTTRHGKPYLASHSSASSTCRFNLSHSEDVALLGITDDVELGVDIEVLREIDDLWSLAGNVFTAREQSELRETPSDRRDSAFLRGWTRKEACLKAVGCGLAIDPRTVDVGLTGNQAQIALNTDNGQFNVQVQTINVGSGAIAAVAYIQNLPDLNARAA
jgi:4'-phosphopantetheinyl transferase